MGDADDGETIQVFARVTGPVVLNTREAPAPTRGRVLEESDDEEEIERPVAVQVRDRESTSVVLENCVRLPDEARLTPGPLAAPGLPLEVFQSHRLAAHQDRTSLESHGQSATQSGTLS